MACLAAQAQTETGGAGKVEAAKEEVKNFDGFLLDTHSLFGTETTNQPLWDLGLFTLPADKKDGFLISPDAYRLNNKVTYLGTSTSTLWIPTYQSLLYPSSLGGKPVQWQGASYKLNNGLRINTYGEYSANGYKRTNPSAMPWQRRNFNAAFEVKSPDGKFGIKLEVSAGRY